MKLSPLSNNVILKAIKAEEKTKSGIVLPESVDKASPAKAEVIACGPGKKLDNGELEVMSVKVGDIVVFKKYAPDEIKIDEEDYMVVSESDIVAVIEE